MDAGASEKPEKQPVRVTILSQSFTLLAKGDPREVELLAESVDELMSSIAAKAPNADTTRVAVLACLHLADRLNELEKDLNSLRARIGRKSEEFAALLEQAFESGEKVEE
jgi:cell division protein ZapA